MGKSKSEFIFDLKSRSVKPLKTLGHVRDSPQATGQPLTEHMSAASNKEINHPSTLLKMQEWSY